MKETLLYDSVPAIAGLNRVDGFEPRTMMRELGDSQNKTLYLDVLFRKLWFRLKNPNGRISKRIIKLTDQVAVVEARIYLDKGDGEENYLANAFSLRFFNADGEFGSKYLEMAASRTQKPYCAEWREYRRHRRDLRQRCIIKWKSGISIFSIFFRVR